MSRSDLFVTFGDRIYAVDREWARFPYGMNIGTLSKCSFDSRGFLYICQRSDPPVLVLDHQGNLVSTFGDGLIIDSHGIFISSDDRVFVVDRDGHEVVIFDNEGELLFTLGDRRRPRFQAPFNHPTDAATGPSGDIYVADGYGNFMVHQFAPDGNLKRSWGEPGTGAGQFTTVHGIKVLKDGRVLVGDRENNRVQVFNAEGNYLTEWHGFYHPMDIYADGRGLVYVSDQVPSVQARREDGTLVGQCKPAIASPHGLSGDIHNNLFIIDTQAPAITKLTPVV